MRSAPAMRQRGFVAVLVLAVFIMGSLYVLTRGLNEASAQSGRDDRDARVLQQARDALIAYAALRPTRPGALPCPDLDDDGIMGGNHPTNAAWNVPQPFGVACDQPGNRIGRLPWRTLNLPDLRDGGGEGLWYALSNNFRNIPANRINSDTLGELRVRGIAPSSNVIAIIFAPGAALAGQNRSIGINRNLPANYLEGENFDAANDLFEILAKSDAFNDRLILIRSEDLFPVVENVVAKRLETEVAPMLRYLRDRWDALSGTPPIFPFAAPFDPGLPATALCGTPGSGRGLLPVGQCLIYDPDSKVTDTGTGGGSLGPNLCGEVTLAGQPDSDRMMAIYCDITYTQTATGAPNVTPNVQVYAEFDRAVRSLAVPVEGPGVPVVGIKFGNSAAAYTGGTAWGSIISQGLDSTGDLEVTYGGNLPDLGLGTHTVKITIPVYSAQFRYQQPPTSVDTSWFFDNDWYRHTYYAVVSQQLHGASGSCDPLAGTCFTVLTYPGTNLSRSALIPGPTNDKQVLLVLAGRARPGVMRPSTNLADYFEDRNVDAPADFEFEQRVRSPLLNDKVVVVAPCTPPGPNPCP